MLYIIIVGNNMIYSPGAISLAKSLEENNVLTHLDIGNNDISPEGIAEISKVLQVKMTVTSLNISMLKCY